MNTLEKTLGFGAFFSGVGVLLIILGNPYITEMFGLWIISVPVVAGITTFASLFYVYRNKTLSGNDLLWIVCLAIFFVFVIPFFWYQKIYKPNNYAT